ncbi:hypothetical protein C8F04DRAFT_1153812 [Mycena alexandri]|uniref:DUF6534 domain-containing protein n=1 Tax=Mycena alexandri TaxID=1745969 RepID=A0AAD6WR60_9AGAR|nr:hypothetical protein C8F04DRAFT_1153812 [Mycena alexandri]
MPYYTNNLGLFLGIILAGSWLNLVFYTTEIILFVYHLPRWTLKPVYKYGSYALLANDAVGTFAVCANAFLCAVDGPVRPLWPSHVLLISTALAAFMEQSFLIHRYYRVAIGKVMSIFLMLIASAHLVFAVIAVKFGEASSKFLFDQKIEASTIGAILCSFVDLLIALSICWSLSGIEPMWRSTQQLIRVLCINALASGTVVAAVTLLSSATTIAKGTNSIIFTLFYASNGRIYSLTILVNIIIRNAQRDDENTLHVTQFVDSVARNPPTTQQFSISVERTPQDTSADDSSHEPPASLSKSTLSIPGPDSDSRPPRTSELSAISLAVPRARASYALESPR